MPRARLLRAFVLLLALASSGCRTAGGGGGRAAHVSSLGSMHNVTEIDGVWTGSLPTPADLDLARRRGIALAIDLTPAEEEPGYDVRSICAQEGISYLRLEVKKQGLPDETIDRVLSELRNPERKSVLLFCGDGSRAAMMFAIWRALDGDIGIERAIVEARRAGMKPGVPESFVRLQVARRAERSEEKEPART